MGGYVLLQLAAKSAIGTLLVLAILSLSFAQVRTSSNYQIQSDSINIGGGLSSSTNFVQESTVGEIATGPSDSSTYQLRAGYQQMQEVFLSMTTPADVVMNPSLGGLTGGTSNGSTSVVVTTDSPSGYRLSIESENNPSMQSPEGGVIDDYGGADWYSTAWEYRVELQIPPEVIDETLTDFPIYINLADLPAGAVGRMNNDCGDIRVTDSSNAEVPREVVSCNTGAETGEVHFKASALSSSATTSFYIYYDNDEAIDYTVDEQFGAQNVWTNDFVGVWHFNEDPNSTDGVILDSTANANHGSTTGSMVLADLVSGQVGQGLDFDGTDDAIGLPTTVDVNEAITLCTWSFNRTFSTGNDQEIIIRTDTANTNSDFLLEFSGSSIDGGTRRGLEFRSAANGTIELSYPAGGSEITTNEWNHICVSYTNDAGGDLFVNSVSRASIDGTGDNLGLASNESPSVGGRTDSAQDALDGIMDEFRIASTSRSDAWISAEYINQATSTDFYTVGSEETVDSSGAMPTFTFDFVSTDAVFGFSPFGDDVIAYFQHDGADCNNGGSTIATDRCWDGLSIGAKPIAESTSPNLPSGATTTIYFRVGLGGSVGLAPGVYTATSTLTAVSL
ncbi:MAG: LamG domain-containing protein [Patescibacteria group bacterium]